ncbi:serine hydrolase domain-containing protein [Pontimicrobium sp. SW4]|uniref:Serine hydrolase domain-containing protein n=1 Tax=Pontimicrobium sp. SW4 TaxID=3153519 RepID=A0AAU7BRD7_9FLAO
MKNHTLKLLITFIITTNLSYGQYQKVEKSFDNLYSNNQFNGTLLIGSLDSIQFIKSYGLSKAESLTPISDKTIFNIASISKQFTAAGIMLLCDRSQLDLDDFASKYLVDFPYKNITIRQLLNHTSGLHGYLHLWFTNRNKNEPSFLTNKYILNLFNEIKPELDFSSGESFKYTNSGYLVLASIIEAVSKISFQSFLQKEFFIPLGLNSAYLINPNDNANEFLANRYTTDFKLMENKPPEGIYGDKNVALTIKDLFKWTRAYYGNQDFFSPAMLSQSKEPAVLNDNTLSNYGFAWTIDSSNKYHHSGSQRGFVSWAEVDEKKNRIIIILTNRSMSSVKSLANIINSILDNEPIKALQPTKLERKSLKAFEKKYRITN